MLFETGVPTVGGFMKKINVLFHVDESDKWAVTLTNVKNLLDDVGTGELNVEIVANAAAVAIFSTVEAASETQSALHDRMATIATRGVDIVACRNALKANHVKEDSLPPFVVVVPAGITEIVKQQMAGFAYVKP
jgi:uncharacterized protein